MAAAAAAARRIAAQAVVAGRDAVVAAAEIALEVTEERYRRAKGPQAEPRPQPLSFVRRNKGIPWRTAKRLAHTPGRSS